MADKPKPKTPAAPKRPAQYGDPHRPNSTFKPTTKRPGGTVPPKGGGRRGQ